MPPGQRAGSVSQSVPPGQRVDSTTVTLAPPDHSTVADSIDLGITDTEDPTERRDEMVAAVTDHAGQIAYQLARLQGGDYGSRDFDTKTATWTVKYEAGSLQYLRYDGGREDVYIVSQHGPPDPEDLADAMRDYPAFVRAYNDYVRSLDGVLDDVATDFPTVESTESVVAERDRVLDRVRELCTEIAGQLYRFEGTEYDTFAVRVAGSRWELKRELDQVSYLRVGGEGGVYLLSQYQAPSAHDVRRLTEDVPAFVEAYNDYVAELDADLAGVEL